MSKFQFTKSQVAVFVSKMSAAAKGEAKAQEARKFAMQQAIDAATIAAPAGDKAKAWKSMGLSKQFEALLALEACGLAQNTRNMYKTCAKIAFIDGVEWTPSLAKDKAKTKAAEPAKESAEPAKSGAVSTTTVEALFQTLLKARDQAKLLNMRTTADEITEMLVEAGYKEALI